MPYVERGDARIWWDERGEGEPLLLIQGLGYPGDMWFRLVPALAARYRVLWFDNGGPVARACPKGRIASRRWPMTRLPCSTQPVSMSRT